MDEKIEAVARALCRFDGKDPDQSSPARRAPGFQTYVGEPPADGPKLWTTYKLEAERFVIAAEALGPLLATPETKRW